MLNRFIVAIPMSLAVDNIELYYGDKRILYGIYLQASKGKVTGILGRNGCGKTSLLKIIFGSLLPKYKSIRWKEQHIRPPFYTTGHVAYLPQHQLLPKGMGISRALRLFGSQWDNFIRLFPSFSNYSPKMRIEQLSSGELRLMETYLILNSGKEVLLLDEPFSFVAPIYVETLKKIIQDKKETSTLLITDHFYEEMMDCCDCLYLIKNGCSMRVEDETDLVSNGYISPKGEYRP